ncbi:hypothetical protein [Dactylosporangium sp. NPDC051484]|uniref:hypothetical protein n=1 Tax=Dactylosporangium sp. NPDC051484 TaxID=3154942 RepID=UPI00344B5139
MEWWDETIGERGGCAASLARNSAAAVATVVMADGLAAVRAVRPLIVPIEVGRFVDRTLAIVRQSAPDYRLQPEVGRELFADLRAVLDGSLTGPCGPLLFGVSSLLDIVTEGAASDLLLDILSSTYEFVFTATMEFPPTDEAEHVNVTCREMIALQNRLLDEYCS